MPPAQRAVGSVRKVPGATQPNIVVLIASVPIQVQCESPSVGSIVPIAAAEEHALCDFTPLSIKTDSKIMKIFSSSRPVSCQFH